MTNRVKVVRASIWRTLQERGIVHGEARETARDIRATAMPDAFTFRGIPLTYPLGPDKEILRGVRLERLNEALVANGNKPMHPHLATMKIAQRAYTALYNKTKQPDYDPNPVVKPAVEHVTPRKRPGLRNSKGLRALEQALRELNDNS